MSKKDSNLVHLILIAGIVFGILFGSLIGWALPLNTAHAQSNTLQDQWTPETKVWMARAWIAEAGWGVNKTKRLEQHAIGWALVTKWRQRVRVTDRIRLVTVIRAYCAGLGQLSRKGLSKRQLWVRELFGSQAPKEWPRNVKWKYYQSFWRDTLTRVVAFSEGKIKNPCPGASHFGGLKAGDVPKGNMVRHKCSDIFENQKWPGTTFYKVAARTL